MTASLIRMGTLELSVMLRSWKEYWYNNIKNYTYMIIVKLWQRIIYACGIFLFFNCRMTALLIHKVT